ncbi:MAG: isoleucine--tRNA ligase [Bacteroidetes bacterium]|nr:isoleucine--tRNA ligase [Bacteroidota bacterium]
MMSKYPEYRSLDLSQIGKDILKFWDENKIFEKSVTTREGKTPFVFYEGPPSANGMPGIHHVMARAIKDIFCRYQTLKGKQVKRKAGWDTHGLPIELAVEKTLGITKEDIGKKITVEEYNQACRKEVMKYTDKWEELTRLMGYWVDMKEPYITYENTYIESVWWLLNDLYKKGLLYKGYTIQPYSPAAGTGLSSHEINQPGCYRNVKDRTGTVMFKTSGKRFFEGGAPDVYFLAWTTTPWTLPSNTALAVGADITYVLVNTYNQFTGKNIYVILAKDLVEKYFNTKAAEIPFSDYKPGDKLIPYKLIDEFKGKDLAGISYEQLLPFVKPQGDAFKVLVGDFVTTTDGTGIVHIAPSFGADDFRVVKQNGIGSLTLVDKRGKFLPEVKDGVFLYGDEYVKEAYLSDEEKKTEFEKQKKTLEAAGKIKDLKVYLSVDERIVLKLQEEGKLFKKETYEHSYPHCWRTDKPVLYYPLDSWFIKVTAAKDKMVALNKTINWKPESTGTGRFGNWLENANDWNLSRSRFWGIPLPIWRTEDGKEEICIGSAEQLKNEIDKSVKAGFMKANPLAAFKPGDNSKENYNTFDLHKPYTDEIVLVSLSGQKMIRENDLIDVWFDSGAMPYAQVHYPFENKELIDGKKYFPADFIAEGVDQTRGWFYTLHAIASMCFDSVAYKNVVSNGLVLDKNGNKMSKRLGNAVDPFSTLEKYGPDATRWYMITNAQPWDNLKFDLEGIAEVQRKFFGTLYNTYSFFVLYANIDGFAYKEAEIPVSERPEIDRWILSELHSLIKVVDQAYSDYEPTKAGRTIEYFLDEHLSNWYVRLCRRRFWKGEYTNDKIAAYQTLYRCLEVIAQLASPIAPFFTDKLFNDLNTVTGRHKAESVHISNMPVVDEKLIDKHLEERMELAQKISSMILSIRKKENIRVRQPLNSVQIPILDEAYKNKIEAVKDLILSEVNVKRIEFVDESKTQIVKNMKLNFKTLGKKCGKHMKAVQAFVANNAQAIISAVEKTGKFDVTIEGETYILENEDIEIIPIDIPGWKVANEGPITVALDITLTSELKEEGIARELVNRIQNLRKDKDFEVTDRILVKIQSNSAINSAVSNNLNYICTEILASSLELVDKITENEGILVEVDDEIKTLISIVKLN